MSARDTVVTSTRTKETTARAGSRTIPRRAFWIRRTLAAALLATSCLGAGNAYAQDAGIEPGEAFATRFSGFIEEPDGNGGTAYRIDVDGVVGSIIDIRRPGREPGGTHWLEEPQRNPVTAGEIGQVFGITADAAEPPNIYLTATAAFGLHRNADHSDWAPGMWGAGGGPGTIYRLSPENDYRPEIFANVTLDGRENTGAALGNITYDERNDQLFVSDLETGMIFRIDAETGEIRDHYDHGVDGRAAFVDQTNDAFIALPVIEFDRSSEARLADCPGDFARTPECWNVADFRRRVWGLGMFPEPDGRSVRLYYAVWSSDPFASSAWTDAPEEERKNSLWSIAIAEDGSFDTQDVRREFILPDFGKDDRFNGAAVSDMAFSRDGTVVLAERGGLGNEGLDAARPFGTPFISRVLQYKRRDGIWTPLARFDIGYYDRRNEGPPFIRANAAGGVSFGYGYTASGQLDLSRPHAVMWASGDYLCSRDAPCNHETEGEGASEDQVHGLQGTPRKFDAEILPEAALEPYPQNGVPYPPTGPANSYLIDLNINVDAFGRIDLDEIEHDDATMIGDIEIFSPVSVVAQQPSQPTSQAPTSSDDPNHDRQVSTFHRRYDSDLHDRAISAPTHDGTLSHNRAGSQNRNDTGAIDNDDDFDDRDDSHSRTQSNIEFSTHDDALSHYRGASHERTRSHWRYGSHDAVNSHYRIWSHDRSESHGRFDSHTRSRSEFRFGTDRDGWVDEHRRRDSRQERRELREREERERQLQEELERERERQEDRHRRRDSRRDEQQQEQQYEHRRRDSRRDEQERQQQEQQQEEQQPEHRRRDSRRDEQQQQEQEQQQPEHRRRGSRRDEQRQEEERQRQEELERQLQEQLEQLQGQQPQPEQEQQPEHRRRDSRREEAEREQREQQQREQEEQQESEEAPSPVPEQPTHSRSQSRQHQQQQQGGRDEGRG